MADSPHSLTQEPRMLNKLPSFPGIAGQVVVIVMEGF